MVARFVAVAVCLLACVSLSSAAPAFVGNGWSYTSVIESTGAALRYAMGQAWDANGNYYLAEGGPASTLYKFKKSTLPFTGQSLDPSSPVLQYAHPYGGTDNADGIVFRKGKLYMAQAASDRVVELDPATGQIIGTIASSDYPLDIKVDPLSGDLFFSSLARSGGGGVFRIAGLDSGNPVTSQYAKLDGIDGISFSADGTIYASSYYLNKVIQISRPNDTAPVISNFAFNIVRPDGNAIAVCNGEEVLIVVSASDKAVYKFKLSDLTRTRETIVSGASSKLDFAFVGPDNAFYISVHGDPDLPHALVTRLYNPDCTFVQPPGNPPPTGTCGSDANCQAKAVSTNCASASVVSSTACATLTFSSSAQNC